MQDDFYLSLLDWSPFTDAIAVGLGRSLYCWEGGGAGEARAVAQLPADDSVAAVGWQPGAACVAVGSKQGRIELFDVAQHRSVQRFAGHCRFRTGARLRV